MRLSDIGAKNDMPKGWVSKHKAHDKIYNMWKGILRRCFDEDFKEKHPTYKECTCHEDFLLLSNFVKWIENEPNYPLLVEDPGCYKWSIDKDGIVDGNKEYAPGKIQLVTLSDNVKESNSRMDYSFLKSLNKDSPMYKTDGFRNYVTSDENKQHCRDMANKIKKPVIGVNIINGYILVYDSAQDAYRDGFTYVTKVCRGHRKACKGYLWYYLDKDGRDEQ